MPTKPRDPRSRDKLPCLSATEAECSLTSHFFQNRTATSKPKSQKKQFPIPENPLKKRIQKTQSHLWYTDRFPYPPYKCSRIITAPTTIISHHQNAPKTPPQTTSNPPPTPGKIRQKNARNSIPPLRLLYMHNLFSKISLTYARIG